MFFAAMMIALFGLVEILLLRILNRQWWTKRLIRRFAIGLPIAGVLCIVAWFVGFFYKIEWMYASGATLTAVALVLLVSLMLSLPISGVFNLILRWLEKRHSQKPDISPVNKNRRAFLKGAAAVLPVTTIAMSVGGVGRAFGDTNIKIKEMAFENLPADLDGFTILHLTDLHLGIYKFLPDLEEVLIRAEKFEPDLVLVTGDVADEIGIYPDTLKLIGQFKAPYGHFGSLGNHEYYRGIKEVLRAYDKGPFPLLRSSSAVLNVGETNLLIAGADDPVNMRQNPRPFLRQSTAQALLNQPITDFKILMSHRPEGFDTAYEKNIEMTLSGHTHGGQVGFNGRSVFDMFMSNRYLWGKYIRGDCLMNVSSGIGHWFPFRLGCPPEAPIIKLTTKS
jgi:predicted MPP superfamily phosphohydrolase